MDNTSLEALKRHLFETIEGVKNNNDASASQNEKISVQQAKAIVDAADSIIDIYKVQLEAMSVTRNMGTRDIKPVLSGLGFADQETVKHIE